MYLALSFNAMESASTKLSDNVYLFCVSLGNRKLHDKLNQ